MGIEFFWRGKHLAILVAPVRNEAPIKGAVMLATDELLEQAGYVPKAERDRYRAALERAATYLRARCGCGVYEACHKCRAAKDAREALMGPALEEGQHAKGRRPPGCRRGSHNRTRRPSS